MRQNHISLRARIALVAIASLVGLIIVEVALWVIAPVRSPYEDIERLKPQINQYIRFEYPRHYSVVTEAEPDLPGLSGTRRFTINNMGFRGDSLADPKPPNEFRVFMVGGSTTECFYLDDEEDLARVVQRELGAAVPAGSVIRVYNAGYSGAASDDHVATISQRIVHFEPDLVIVFCGINDLLRSLNHYDYRHYIEYRPAYRKPWYKRWPMHLQITRRLFLVKRRFKGDTRDLQEERSFRTNYRGLVGLQRSVPESDLVPRTDVPSFATGLRTMAGIARANRFGIVFMTQQTTWNSTVDPEAKRYQWLRYRAAAPGAEGPANGVTFREDAMDAALEQYNDAMRALCASESIPLYDLARTLPKSLEFFYDDCHFNPVGAMTAGQGLARFIIGHGLTPED